MKNDSNKHLENDDISKILFTKRILLIAALAVVVIAALLVLFTIPEGYDETPLSKLEREQVYTYINHEIENCLNSTILGFPGIDYTCLSFANDDAGQCEYAENPKYCYSTYYIFKSASKSQDLCSNIEDLTGKLFCEILISGNADRCDEMNDLPKTHRAFNSMVCKAILNHDSGLCDPARDDYEVCINGIRWHYSAKNHDVGECLGILDLEALDIVFGRNERLCKVLATGDVSFCGVGSEVSLQVCKN